MTATHIQQIIEAQAYFIENPVSACVNSESSFVKQRLQQQGFLQAASLYWSFATSRNAKYVMSDETVIAQEKQLDKASNFNMPAWGTSGT